METHMLQWWMFIPPLAVGVLLRWFWKLWLGFFHLRPRRGNYLVHRKAGEPYNRMPEMELGWNWLRPAQLTLTTGRIQTDYAGVTGVVYFKDSTFGKGFYKGNVTSFYGLASFLLFPKDEIGYHRLYVKDDKEHPQNVSTDQEISSQFVLKRK